MCGVKAVKSSHCLLYQNKGPNLGLKVFMDARSTVTAKEGDRYPLRPPSFAAMEWGRRHILRILVSRSGSSPLAAPSFASVSKRMSRYLGMFELPK